LAFWKKSIILEWSKIIIFHGEINPHKTVKGGRGKWVSICATGSLCIRILEI